MRKGIVISDQRSATSKKERDPFACASEKEKDKISPQRR